LMEAGPGKEVPWRGTRILASVTGIGYVGSRNVDR